jgi:hypothetical protein
MSNDLRMDDSAIGQTTALAARMDKTRMVGQAGGVRVSGALNERQPLSVTHASVVPGRWRRAPLCRAKTPPTLSKMISIDKI